MKHKNVVKGNKSDKFSACRIISGAIVNFYPQVTAASGHVSKPQQLIGEFLSNPNHCRTQRPGELNHISIIIDRGSKPFGIQLNAILFIEAQVLFKV